MNLPAEPLAVWLLSVNLAAFALMGADKYRARRNMWRIPEKTLFLPAFLGGTPGAILGMRLFRHKTRHRKFRYGLPSLLTVQLAAAGWYLLS
ncbi:MAG: DUF1294 domain-containing protein [Oscillospiraceae bacterium]|nr:DUF1294 domain-containing protein [Oscillospiraceae bacterium]